MSFLAERSVWDWAEQIAAQHNEPSPLVLAEIVTAIDRGKLSASVAAGPNEDWRQLLAHIAVAARTHWAAFRVVLPHDEGIWLLTHRIVIGAGDMQDWLGSRSPMDLQSSPKRREQIPSGIRTNKARSAEDKCREWIGALKARPLNKEEAFAEAKVAVQNIGPLSRKAFERAWAATAPLEWLEPGRRKRRLLEN